RQHDTATKPLRHKRQPHRRQGSKTGFLAGPVAGFPRLPAARRSPDDSGSLLRGAPYRRHPLETSFQYSSFLWHPARVIFGLVVVGFVALQFIVGLLSNTAVQP